ncbi:MAG: hypothetical protein Hyperionvirus1_139 [Hyperionvirus sp.]|uniref:Uncharacterized protein n=1 Tax=Hyperionvirus sp. TaxID=2487770 RepID=A0A3G5A5M7_9VIRU|nr:MAG: hypothetical protein Hyperionvirus1_139 [Hyperionvirus sp.]
MVSDFPNMIRVCKDVEVDMSRMLLRYLVSR